MLWESDFLRFLEKLELIAAKTRHTLFMGQLSSHKPGNGLEFKDYRSYQRGDDFRYIDWNLFSRLEQLFLKEFVEERDFLVYLLIDKSSSMGLGTPSKLEFAIKLAAALGYIALAGADQVGGAFFSTYPETELKPIKGKNRFEQLFTFLEQAQAGGRTDLNYSLSFLGQKYKKPGLVVILSDLHTEKDYEDGLKILKKRGWEIWIFQILDQWELKPTADQEVYLIDAETGRTKEVILNQEAIKSYLDNFKAMQTRTLDLARHYGFSFLTLSTAQPVEEVLIETLYKERLIR